jgi:DNA-binding response OmpR family regulator
MTLRRRRVLLVEDHGPLAENVSEILAGRGFDTVVATTGEAALQHAEAVDIVITDLRLPGMSGLQLIAALRRRGVQAPALLVTAFADPGLLSADSGGHDVDRVLQKPIDPETLMARVEELVSRCPDSNR